MNADGAARQNARHDYLLPQKLGKVARADFPMARTYLVFGDIEGKLDCALNARSAPAGAATTSAS
jgi:hypothetical protein